MHYKDSTFLSPVALGVIKLDQQGGILWTKFVKGQDGALSALGSHIQNNNCYLTGVIQKTFQFDNITLTGEFEAGGDIFIAKLNLPAKVVGVSEKDSFGNSCGVFPNPTTDHITITCTETKTVQIKITNILGQCIYSKHCKPNGELNERVQTNIYPKGIYFVEVSAEKGKEVKKVTLE